MKKPLGEKLFGNRLIKAAEQGNTDSCQRQLTRRGVAVSATVNTRHRSSGNSPLHQACANGHICTARLLLEKGAKINANNIKGETPLMMACRNRQVEIVRFLLQDYYQENSEIGSKAGCNVNEKNNAGWTALHYACSFVHRNKKNTICIDIAYLLLNHGALINGARANNGWTALHFASHKGHVRLVKALMDRGANIHAKNKAGKTPVEMANHGCKSQQLLDYHAMLQERKLREQEEGEPLQRSLLTSSLAIEKEQQKNQAEQEIALAKLEENFQTTKQLMQALERHQRTEAMHTLTLRQQLKSLEDRVNEQEQEKVELMEETVNLLEETVDLKAHVTKLEREQKKQKLQKQLAELYREDGDDDDDNDNVADATEATYEDVTESHREGDDDDDDDDSKQEEEEAKVTTAAANPTVRHRSYNSSSSRRSTKRSFRSSSSSASKTPLTRSMA